MSSAYSCTNRVTLIQSDGMIPLQQFADFSRYVPECMNEKERAINSVTNINNKSDEIIHLVNDFKNCIILVLLYPLSIKRKTRCK